MSDENNNGGGGISDLSQEEQQRLQAQLFQQAVAECAGRLSGYFPSASDKTLIEAAARALGSQQQFEPFLNDAADPTTFDELPGWGVQIRRIKGTAASQVGTAICPVDTGDIATPESAHQWVVVMALATSPVARAALELLGYQAQFVRSKNVPGLSRIVPG